MKQIPHTFEVESVARRIVWFELPEQSLEDPVRFMAYAMRYASHSDMKILRKYVADKDFIDAIDHAPPGIIDNRSWAYWNAVFGRFPTPPMPQRTFDAKEDKSVFLPAE